MQDQIKDKLSVGLINIMPNADEYAQLLHRAFANVRELFELVPLRLHSHKSRSGTAHGEPWSEVLADGAPLDLLLLTGAPVEHLPFEEVSYWAELRELFVVARQQLTSTLGICFGGLAIAKYLGIEKRMFAEKCFGVHGVPVTANASRYFGTGPRQLNLALSTWALLDEARSMPLHDGRVQTLARHPHFGPLMLATPDDKFVMVLGHPEYSAETLFKEWQRDVARNIPYTRNFDAAAFTEMALQLEACNCPIFENWLRRHARRIAAPHIQVAAS